MTQDEAKVLSLVAVEKIEQKTTEREKEKEEMRKTLLTDAEATEILRALIRKRGGYGFSEKEAQSLLNTAIWVRFLNSCIELTLKGLIDVDIDMDKATGENLTFSSREDIKDQVNEALNRKDGGA